MKILVVEPQKDLGKLIDKSLTLSGMEVMLTTDAQTAVHAAEQGVDVVVLELALPGHNGVEFLYEFRSYDDWRHIPVVIYSHISSEEAGFGSEVYQRFGIKKHLYKPTTSLQKLADTVRGVALEPTR